MGVEIVVSGGFALSRVIGDFTGQCLFPTKVIFGASES
jgi:hypothetical protein